VGEHPVTSALPGDAGPEPDCWLTTVLRPAGALDRAARSRLIEALSRLADSSDMVIVDLAAACVTAPRTLARKLRAPALAFEQTGRCLLLVGAAPELVTELDRADVRGTVFAAGSLPLPAV
jgi:1,2-phenylacetyl-CoA epoxidase catalytic subunit